ncbi:phthiocerol/phenolphthiocerol synthesis type-I polyketide synthase A [Streptomyces sp. SAI-119]|uniref:beta-ketoacyl synthase N-terminal-like domain-containing protein n=1 Tax=Streptomyces sp. SAI-119 TaxID=2940541 RepID=UPI002475DF8B|nr:beta-ketoacyl synthase N-terminal-like domain-containing protein [Streptomyces sp. SAI-119]MDH6456082.1 phthiocerol/phenolphthiocerol synthesis type-I polyketide synthase A [Streptomyces sp. SAI-119]
MSAVDAAAVRRLVAERVAGWTGTAAAEVPMDRPLADLGMSSRDAVVLAGDLSRLAGRELPPTLLWEALTGEALVAHLCRTAVPTAPTAPATRATASEPVAVIGIGCRLPGGVHGPADYWRLLTDGVDAIGRIPEDRWRDFTPFPPDDVPPYGGFLDDIAGFDADFFRITPREAALMDPQQRILLEVVHEALAHAAVPAASLAGTATGVFVGVSAPEYGALTGADPAAVDPWAPAGAALSVTAGRLAYVLDTRGPSMAVDTACSSSLVAVHHACVSLRTGESDTAIAAGVNVLLSPTVTMAFRRAGALAPDGRCKPFSPHADGIGRGEGCAAVLLKRLSDAEQDGDRVLAVIRATAVNSDGRSNGLLAPNPAAQQALLADAYARAGLTPAQVDYVEAHGTGTPLGDPIEAGALGAVLGAGRDPDQPLLLGSVKSNLGHLESAAGIAGLVKTVLALHHDVIPPSLHCSEGSALDGAHLRVVTEGEPWPRYGGTAVAGVSGFGFGGTNAHAVLEEWRPGVLPPHPAEEPGARLHLLSDVDEERLRDTAARLADWLRTAAAHPADVARTLAGRAGRGGVRAAVIARDRAELADGLDALARGGSHGRVVTGERDLVGAGPVWVFSGYGSQWAGMGRRLLAEEPAFAAAVQKLDAECGLALYDRLASGSELDRLEVAQPVLFGLQVALAELWRSHGVEPAAVIGHSLGEVAAAVCAGALDVSEGARIVAVRARLLSRLRGGAMAVVDLDDRELDVLDRDFPGVHVAVHSSPGQKVVTGEEPAVARLVRWLEGQGRAARSMRVVGAGHSPQVEPLLAELSASLAEVRGRAPRVPVYSTVLDDPRGDCVFDAAHWAANLRRPVRLDRALAAAAADGRTAFVEISPHPVLGRAVTDNVPGALAIGTLRRGADGCADFLTQVGALYCAGGRLPLPSGRVVDVPAPRWRHVRHWWTDGRGTAPAKVRTQGGADVRVEAPEAAQDTSVVARVCHHIAAVTGHPAGRVTPATAPADLGLDSLMAVRVRTALEREFAVELPLRDLLGAGTVQELADRVGAGPVRPLRVTGDRPPLFLVHAAGGTTDVYRALAERLGDERPVYGLERLEDAPTVTEKARRYAEAVTAVHPDGPCLLGGWSFGGFVAQETARQLTAAGRDVELVVLIDSVRPLPQPDRTPDDRLRAHFEGFARHVLDTYGVRLELPYDGLVAMDDDAKRIDTVLEILRASAEVPSAALAHQRSSYLDLRIGEAHRPGRHDGRVVLYRATEPAPHTVRDPAYERDDRALGWDEVCPGLTVVPVAGHHLSLLDPPHVDEIAAHLGRELAGGTRRS